MNIQDTNSLDPYSIEGLRYGTHDHLTGQLIDHIKEDTN